MLYLIAGVSCSIILLTHEVEEIGHLVRQQKRGLESTKLYEKSDSFVLIAMVNRNNPRIGMFLLYCMSK